MALMRFFCCCCFFFPAPCDADAFFCHSNMCINNTLVCNGMQNCVYPWDENQCKGEVSGLIVHTALKISWSQQQIGRVNSSLHVIESGLSLRLTFNCTCSDVIGFA